VVGTGLPSQTCVHHDPDARHGQAALGDTGCQHDAPADARCQCGVLNLRGLASVQRQQVHIGRTIGQPRRDGVDLPHSWEENQNVAIRLTQRAADSGGDVVQQPRVNR